MKLQSKNLILAYVLICLLATTIVPVQAASTTWLEVLINNVNIMLDGTIVGEKGENYTLSNGTQVPNSILYKGTTYVPIRKLGELMGKDIGYIADSQTVVIGAMPLVQGPGWHLIGKEFTQTINNKKSGTFTASTDYWETITDYSNIQEGNVALSTEYKTYNSAGVLGSTTRETYSYLWTTPATFIPDGGEFVTTVSCNSSDNNATIGATYFNDSLNPNGDNAFYRVSSGSQATIKSSTFYSGYEKNTRTVVIILSIGTDVTYYTYTYEYRK